MSRPDKLLKLFLSMLYISAFTFGGGFVIVTLMKKKFVDEYHWISEEEMLDMTALAQSSPGPIAVNAANLVGWHVAGFPGMICAVVGTVIPPMIILSVISIFYAAFSSSRVVALMLRGMQAGVAAVICEVAFNLGAGVMKKKSVILTLLMIFSFAAVAILKINVILVVLIAAAVGVLTELVRKAGAKK